MFSKIFDLIETIETQIGNKARLSISKYGTGVQFRVFWPDGYVLNTIIEMGELEQAYVEETFVSYLTDRAKKAHPTLTPLIS